jgi:glycosyltransferase involved in cell wall biosynthesis
MKVSVIMIFLNGETFIRDAIDSVFSQTYPDWELLLVDDGSSDRSTQIALEYAAKYPEKVRYLEHDKHQNRGMSASRNLGISHAEGKYIGCWMLMIFGCRKNSQHKWRF